MRQGKRAREKETEIKRWALEWAVLQIAPPALETPATTSCSSQGTEGSSAEFLTRARTSNDRDVIGRTRRSGFTWRAPGPGSEAAAFLEENFLSRRSHRTRAEREKEERKKERDWEKR